MSQMPHPAAQRAANLPPGNPRLVLIALVMAVLAVILVNIYIAVDRQKGKVDDITVYRLRVPVKPGESLNDRLIEGVRFPVTIADAFAGEVLDNRGKDNRLGQPFVRSARQGQILTADLFHSGDTARLDLNIGARLRQIALPVNSRAVPGALREGAVVDIHAPFLTPDGRIEVMPVMERVTVMVVGDRTVLDEQVDTTGRVIPRGAFQRIDIQVDPHEAALLAQIKRLTAGDFEIFVRNPSDEQYVLIPDGGINPEVIRLVRQQPAEQRR